MISVFCSTKSSLTVFAQTNDRNQKKIIRQTFKNEPIEFVEPKSNGEKFKFNEKFTQETEWLKDFNLDFKNISNKPIICVSIAITFPETASNGLPMTHFINYGVPPALEKNNVNEPKLLAPNETAQVGLSAEAYNHLTKFLATRNHTLTNLTEAHLTIMLVYFEDGTKWSGGDLYQPNSNRPRRYVAISESEKSQF